MIPIGITKGDASHLAYVKSTFRHSLWEVLRTIPKATWQRASDIVIAKLLAGTTIWIAHPPDDPATILGWLAESGGVMLWVYAPFELRHKGILQQLERFHHERQTAA